MLEGNEDTGGESGGKLALPLVPGYQTYDFEMGLIVPPELPIISPAMVQPKDAVCFCPQTSDGCFDSCLLECCEWCGWAILTVRPPAHRLMALELQASKSH